MREAIVLLAAALAASAAGDPWAKVLELKSGAEIRILKKGSKTPLVGRFDEADAGRVVLVVKTEQMAVAKEDIDRLEARPAGGRVKQHATAKTEDPKFDKPPAGPPPVPRQTQTYNSGLTVGSKPDFETIYRRPPGK